MSNAVLCSSELYIRISTIVVLLIDGFGSSSSSELCGDIFGETNVEFMADLGSRRRLDMSRLYAKTFGSINCSAISIGMEVNPLG